MAGAGTAFSLSRAMSSLSRCALADWDTCGLPHRWCCLARSSGVHRGSFLPPPRAWSPCRRCHLGVLWCGLPDLAALTYCVPAKDASSQWSGRQASPPHCLELQQASKSGTGFCLLVMYSIGEGKSQPHSLF